MMNYRDQSQILAVAKKGLINLRKAIFCSYLTHFSLSSLFILASITNFS